MTDQRGVATRQQSDPLAEMAAVEKVLVQGDLSSLNPAQRVEYYNAVCKSVGLNPLTKPFDYIMLNGKLTLYAKKDCTDQLRSIHGINIDRLERSTDSGIFMVLAYGTNARGRSDSSIGAVPVENLRGENLANAMMKAETKAKRRLTLSLAGLGWLDESEVPAIQGAQTVRVNDQGEIENPSAHQERPKSLEEALARPVAVSGQPADDRAAASEEVEADFTEIARETFADVAASEPAPAQAPAPAKASKPKPAPVIEPRTAPQADGMSWKELLAAIREKLIPAQLLSRTAREMFGEERSIDLTALTDRERLDLYFAIVEANGQK